MAHLHVLLMVPQLVDAFLRKRHKQHVDCDTGDSVIFCLHICEFPSAGVLIRLAFSLRELRRIWKRFYKRQSQEDTCLGYCHNIVQ